MRHPGKLNLTPPKKNKRLCTKKKIECFCDITPNKAKSDVVVHFTLSIRICSLFLGTATPYFDVWLRRV